MLRVSAAVCCLFVFDETTATALCEPPHPTLEIDVKLFFENLITVIITATVLFGLVAVFALLFRCCT